MAIAEYRSRHKDFRLIITDHALALLAIPLLDMPFIFNGVDSNTLYFWRRGISMAMQAPLKALNSFAGPEFIGRWKRALHGMRHSISFPEMRIGDVSCQLAHRHACCLSQMEQNGLIDRH